MKIRNGLLVAFLVISPLASALAQAGTGPDNKASSTKEATDVKNGSATNTPHSSSNAALSSPGSDATAASDRHGDNPANSARGGANR